MLKPLSILIAEDDFAISLALKTVLQSNFNCELHVASNGEDAWQQMNSNPMDIVLSDWNMPQKSGRELLADIRRDPSMKHVPFIMLTARADKESVIQAVKLGVTDYIHKPFNRADLIDKIKGIAHKLEEQAESARQKLAQPNKTASNRDVVKQIVTRLKRQQFELPVLSEIATTVSKMVNEQDASAPELAEVIKQDPVITAKLLALANSAMFSGKKKYNSLAEAVTRLGIPETQNYIWVFSSVGVYESEDPFFKVILQNTRLHALATAECCRLLAKALGLGKSDELYYDGLMHDIGVVLVTRIFEDIAREDPIEDKDAIIDAIEKLKAEFGAVLLKRWGLAEELQKIVLYHEAPEKAPVPSTALNVVYLANLLVKKIGFGLMRDEQPEIEVINTPIGQELGLTEEIYDDLREKVAVYVNQMSRMLEG